MENAPEEKKDDTTESDSANDAIRNLPQTFDFNKIVQRLAAGANLSDRERWRLRNESIDCAKADILTINAIETSFKGDARLNALKVYHLQQAVEHLTKAYAYMFLTKGEVSGHDNFEIFRKLADSFKTQFGSLLDVDRSLKAMEKLQQMGPVDIAKLPAQEINGFIDSVEGVTSVVSRFVSPNIDWDAVVDAALGAIAADPKTDKSKMPTKEKMKELLQKNNREQNILESASILPAVLIIGYLTYPHEAFTRYPDGEITAAEYARNPVGIVACFDRIYTIVNRTVTLLGA